MFENETSEAKNQSQTSRERAQHHRRIIRAVELTESIKRSLSDKISDAIVEWSGSFLVFTFHLLWFGLWLAVNLDMVPRVPVFDPYPFGLLTMIVSLEAIFLSVFVLMSQGRAKRVDDLRAEISLQVGLIAEEEITKMLEIVTKTAKQQGVNIEGDNELQRMLKPLNASEITHKLENQLFGRP